MDVTREIEREQALSEANLQLESLATTDTLTGLSNRRVFEETIAVAFAQAVRTGHALTLMVMDIDNFKARNDTYGHAAGDQALRTMGRVLRESVRAGDTPARVGGEEFVILLPETDEAGARLLAERIQVRLRAADTGEQPLTVSVGIASRSSGIDQDAMRSRYASVNPGASAENWERLVSRADEAMYAAKRSGKDRIVVAHVAESVSYSLPFDPLLGIVAN